MVPIPKTPILQPATVSNALAQAHTKSTTVPADSGDVGAPWIETISWVPRAFIYHGFLSHAECDHLIGLALPKVGALRWRQNWLES